MNQVLVLGGGKIGQLIAVMLAMTDDYEVHLGDISFESVDLNLEGFSGKLNKVILDAKNPLTINDFIKKQKINTLICALPFYLNESIAELALKHGCHYFDLTEDTGVSEKIRHMSKKATSTFATQCGLAPGFITILATSLMRHFSIVEAVYLRVGALPQQAHQALKYALTWSTEGLINEYANPCFGLVNGKIVTLEPLQDLETIELDGALYEAFNTSGGLGSLAESLQGKVKILNYKTLRYPGHCEKIHFLMHDLKLNEERKILRDILEKALPTTQQDVVIVYAAVNGYFDGKFFEKSLYKKYYPKTIAGKNWSAIQISSSAALCAIVDLVHQNPSNYQGVLLQENISLEAFLKNRFGQYLA